MTLLTEINFTTILYNNKKLQVLSHNNREGRLDFIQPSFFLPLPLSLLATTRPVGIQHHMRHVLFFVERILVFLDDIVVVSTAASTLSTTTPSDLFYNAIHLVFMVPQPFHYTSLQFFVMSPCLISLISLCRLQQGGSLLIPQRKDNLPFKCSELSFCYCGYS